MERLYNLKKITGNFITWEACITSYEGIDKLTEIGGDFEVNANSSLESFEGLESLETIGGNFKIIDNESSLNALSSFKGLSSLKSIGGDFEVNAKSS